LTQHAFAFTILVTIVIFDFSARSACGRSRAIVERAAPSCAILIAFAFLHTVHEWRALIRIFVAASRETLELIVAYIVDFLLSILAYDPWNALVL
jgi:hypothetical protein